MALNPLTPKEGLKDGKLTHFEGNSTYIGGAQ